MAFMEKGQFTAEVAESAEIAPRVCKSFKFNKNLTALSASSAVDLSAPARAGNRGEVVGMAFMEKGQLTAEVAESAEIAPRVCKSFKFNKNLTALSASSAVDLSAPTWAGNRGEVVGMAFMEKGQLTAEVAESAEIAPRVCKSFKFNKNLTALSASSAVDLSAPARAGNRSEVVGMAFMEKGS
ncbi:MAG: hypothetical protein R3E01_21155 [Pirellulaceae bacterium]